MSLKKFLEKYKDLAQELVKCGSCANSLVHCGDKYEIVKITDTDYEGLLCETCKHHGRKIETVTTISTDENNVFNVPLSQLDIKNKNKINELSEKKKEKLGIDQINEIPEELRSVKEIKQQK